MLAHSHEIDSTVCEHIKMKTRMNREKEQKHTHTPKLGSELCNRILIQEEIINRK